ncbi:MAG TPA: hypothetical protein VK196_05600 [Magnetospirillum sp.]|nr:hypothetical protein [Magnetospirillum sp.]
MKLKVFGIAVGAILGAAAFLAGPAQAVPAFSHQTGQACSACHVGAMGPQLTPYGRQFKLGGFSDSQGKNDWVPLSIMADASFEHSRAKTVADPNAPSGFKNNNNLALEEVGLFYAGRVYDHLGALAQMTWVNDGTVHRWQWDNTDIRYGRDTNIGGVDATVGVSVNNSPTVSDIYNTTPTWGFPFQSAAGAPGSEFATLIQDGLGGRVIGATAYGLFADTVYVEAGAYRPLTNNQVRWGGQYADEGPMLDGTAPYWRVALQHDMLKQNFSVGTFGMLANVLPNNDSSSGTTDRFRDFGFDATYQWLGDRTHVFSVNATAIREWQKLSATLAAGGAGREHQSLDTYNLNATYVYDQTYGVRLGAFKTHGSHDGTLYTANSANSPDAGGYIAEVDWTPFGKKDSWMQPWVNVTLALQYTGYWQIDGRSTNVDGDGRKASDNNTTALLLRWAF